MKVKKGTLPRKSTIKELRTVKILWAREYWYNISRDERAGLKSETDRNINEEYVYTVLQISLYTQDKWIAS